ncbi:MAG: DUF1611 domain-containing protein [bacterium]|jgi:uncharacterized NAD-dependent epimerase/dehydratase family protein|nr:DUF1611 domain-containing protein [candidate division KSB1 bacterium]MDH7561474.1 DUF1611 domain-containing protein [bacterium]
MRGIELLREKRRFVILTEGNTHPTPGKTAAGVVRYRGDEVVALIDSTQAGGDTEKLLGVGKGIPILASLAEALALRPDTLLIGISPAGGQLPPSWRAIILQAIDAGLDVVAGLHVFLGDDPEFAVRAKERGVSLVDVRRVPDELTVNNCRAQELPCFRVHTVGSDCNIGKKIVALEVAKVLQAQGRDAVFVATGQTGIMISGRGMALDRVIADFVAGAAERLVLENAAHDYLLIEGQGALTHPLYSGVMLSMLHGFAPHALILCHEYGRTIMRGSKNTPVPSIAKAIALYEAMAEPVFPAKVVGIALNLRILADEEAEREVARVEQETGLPTTDVVKFGADKLVQAILAYEKEWRAGEAGRAVASAQPNARTLP